jgi:hypothetical protein
VCSDHEACAGTNVNLTPVREVVVQVKEAPFFGRAACPIDKPVLGSLGPAGSAPSTFNRARALLRPEPLTPGVMYLHRPPSSKSAYHLFNGIDTACRMWATGGLRKEKYVVSETKPNKRLCHMCAVNLKKVIDAA